MPCLGGADTHWSVRQCVHPCSFQAVCRLLAATQVLHAALRAAVLEPDFSRSRLTSRGAARAHRLHGDGLSATLLRNSHRTRRPQARCAARTRPQSRSPSAASSDSLQGETSCTPSPRQPLLLIERPLIRLDIPLFCQTLP